MVGRRNAQRGKRVHLGLKEVISFTGNVSKENNVLNFMRKFA